MQLTPTHLIPVQSLDGMNFIQARELREWDQVLVFDSKTEKFVLDEIYRLFVAVDSVSVHKISYHNVRKTVLEITTSCAQICDVKTTNHMIVVGGILASVASTHHEISKALWRIPRMLHRFEPRK
jgi:hypothetical protein